MKKTVVIHQPDFFPYLGFFHRLLRADLYIVLDHVQFVYGSRAWTHRDKIKTQGGAKWLTLSVKKPPRGTPINNVVLSSDSDWQKKHLQLLKENYLAAPYFSEIFGELEKLYEEPCYLLQEFTLKSIEYLSNSLEVDVPWIMSSSLDPQGNKSWLMADLLSKVGATHYLSGLGAKDYFDPEPFIQANVEVVWQDFTHPVYPQLNGEFISYLSCLDILFNCGKDRSRQILREI